MLHIVGRPQEGIGRRTSCDPIRLKLPDKQQHLAPPLPVMDIPLSSRRICRRGALALPMEQALIDGVVVIHGGGRVVLVRLIQCHKEHVQLLLRQPLHALTHCGRLQEIQCHQQLVPGIGAVEIQRAFKAQVHRLVDEIDLFIPIAEQGQKFTQQHRTVRESIQIVQHLIGCPALRRLAPNGHIEHLEHPLLQLTQRREVHIVQTGQQVQHKAYPPPGVHNSQPAEGFCQCFLHRFAEILHHIRPGADAGKGGEPVNRPGVQVVIFQKVCQGQLQPAVLRKAGHPGHQSGGIAVGGADVVQDVLGCFLLQLYVAALGRGDKPVLDLPGHAAGGIAQEGGKLVLEVISLVGLADKVQHGQAFFILCQPQATAQLLEEDGQGLGGPQEQHGVDLRDVHTLVVDVHHEDEAHLTADQSLFGGLSLLIGGFSGQENGRDSAAVEIAAHKLRVLNGHAETQPLDLVDVGHILEKGGHHQVGAAVCHGAAEGIKIGELPLIVTTSGPFQGVQIHRIGDAEILEGTQQLAVDGLRQTDLGGDPVIEVGQHTLAVHTLRGGGQTQQDLGLVVGQQLLVGGRCRMVEFVHHDVVVEIRGGLSRKVLGVESLNGQKQVVNALWPVAAHKQFPEVGILQNRPEGV